MEKINLILLVVILYTHICNFRNFFQWKTNCNLRPIQKKFIERRIYFWHKNTILMWMFFYKNLNIQKKMRIILSFEFIWITFLLSISMMLFCKSLLEPNYYYKVLQMLRWWSLWLLVFHVQHSMNLPNFHLIIPIFLSSLKC